MNIKITTQKKEIFGELADGEIFTEMKINDFSELVETHTAKPDFYATSIEAILENHEKITIEKL